MGRADLQIKTATMSATFSLIKDKALEYIYLEAEITTRESG